MSIRNDISSKVKVHGSDDAKQSDHDQAIQHAATRRLDQAAPATHHGPSSAAATEHTHQVDFSLSHASEEGFHNRFSWLEEDNHPQTQANQHADETSKNPGSNDHGYQGSGDWNPVGTAQALKDGLGQLDSAAGGKRDGKFGIADLQAVANDPNASPELKKAAQDVLADRNLMNAIDVAGGDEVDGVFSAKDLDRVVSDSKNDTDHTSLAQTQVQFSQNFDALDSAQNGKKDGKVSQGDLQAILQDPNAKPEAKQLAQRLLGDRTLWNAFDVANRDARDGIVSKGDVEQIQYSPTPEAGQQWGPDQQKALSSALSGDRKFGDVITDFGQTDRGNCVVTAAIKAGIDHFGNKLFSDVKPNANGGYDVTMRDGYKVSLTADEMEAAATGAHFQDQGAGGDPEAMAYGTLAYAAAAKRAQNEHNDGARTYAEAMLAMNDGASTEDGLHWVGLDNNYKAVSLDDLKGRESLVIDGNGHTFYATGRNDQLKADHWGSEREWNPKWKFDSKDQGDPHNEDFKPDGAYEIVG